MFLPIVTQTESLTNKQLKCTELLEEHELLYHCPGKYLKHQKEFHLH